MEETFLNENSTIYQNNEAIGMSCNYIQVKCGRDSLMFPAFARGFIIMLMQSMTC